MPVLPVLDLLEGVVVRGVAGRRAEYRPLRSRLVETAVPLDVARALRTEFGFQQLYVADLDGIVHQCPNWIVYQQLIDDGFKLLVDAGITTIEDARRLRGLGCDVVIGLESSPSPRHVERMAEACEAVTFSLDLQDGQPLLAEGASGWSPDPREIVRLAVACGISRIIVLDLADVGMGNGTRTGSLCQSLLTEFPDLHLTCGGGIRNLDDLRQWRAFGAKQILAASALHDGRLTKRDLAAVAAIEGD
jgi:phosphoribosylformimino-5-aminoimidazole carboxamide ribotide isomerase